MKDALEAYYPNEWKVVATAIASVALYLKNEIVRCKHDTAHYMMGLDAPEDYGKAEEIELIHEKARRLPAALDRAGQAKSDYESERENPIESANLKGLFESDMSVVTQITDDLKKLSKELEGRLYGEG